MKNIWHDISPKRITPDTFYAVIEISKGSKMKYELDKETGLLRLDRVLYTSTHYPANYGFIPRTYAKDNDPLDVLVLCSEQIQPMSIVECYPIGVITMIDSGRSDEKIINNFYNVLKKHKINATIRREFGKDIEAACGQLRAKSEGKKHETNR